MALHMRTNSFDTIRQRIEYSIHADVHIFIRGDMETMSSPNDAIFYMHHANVDRLWNRWQRRNGGLDTSYNGPSATGTASSSNIMNMGFARVYTSNGPVSDLFDIYKWCYTYSAGTIPLSHF